MNNRVYLLLDVAEAKADQVAGKLESLDSISVVDVLEGQPNVIVMVEASEQHKLAETAMRVIASVENMIDDLKLLPARDRKNNCINAFTT
jgi:nitrate reductase NapAB chaperone NapD